MNNDLISREALLKAMEEERQYLLARGETGAEHILVHHCLPIIDNAPTIETYTEDDIHYAIKEGHQVGYEMAKAKFERPQGEWIKGQEISRTMIGNKVECIGYKDYTCSNCGLVLDYLLYNQDGSAFYKYCPNCGALMEDTEDNENEEV